MATNVDAKLLKQTKFPPEFNLKVDMKKVNVEVLKKWIAGRISEVLGNEDDVVIELCFNLLEGSRFPDVKVLQIQLTGFLDKDTPKFCKDLWTLCLSAQSSPQGVPKELLEAKKAELIQEKIDAEKAAQEAQRRTEQERVRDRNIDGIRQRERAERGRGRGRGGVAHHDYERRAPRDSRSPPPRRRQSPYRADYRGPPPRDYIDTYIPGDRNGRYHERRRRSPSLTRRLSRRSLSRSRTPPRRHRDEDPRPRHRRYSPSRSPTTPRRDDRRDRRQRAPGRRGDRARSYTPSDTSRSQSPRRPRRRRSPSISTRSATPPPRTRHRKHRHDALSSPSMSRSRSRSIGDRKHTGRSRKSPSYTSDEAVDARADGRKGRSHRDRRRRSRDRNRSGQSDRKPAGKAPSRSPSASRQRERKRHRSIERYAPAARRRRNTSSVSSPVGKRHKTADSSAEEANRQPPKPTGNPIEDTSATTERNEEVDHWEAEEPQEASNPPSQ
ncbi:MAG: hypothetical protein Q9181_003059 [Wetmoreana brouardii]